MSEGGGIMAAVVPGPNSDEEMARSAGHQVFFGFTEEEFLAY
jgi:hypothetical protein